jgi:plastocyanin
VQIHNLAFAPAADTVRVGHTVTFWNHDLVPHTATADTAGLDSGAIAADGFWRFIARRKGVIAYHCRFHPTMHGTLVIR